MQVLHSGPSSGIRLEVHGLFGAFRVLVRAATESFDLLAGHTLMMLTSSPRRFGPKVCALCRLLILTASAVVALLLLRSSPLHAEPGGIANRSTNACTTGHANSSAPSAKSIELQRPANDWAWVCRYREENRLIMNSVAPDIVFFGDSITEHWTASDPTFFGERRIGRGISGQTSAQMLLRFHQDTIALKPKVIHLLAGGNDVARNAGALDSLAYQNNVRAMADMADAHNISLVIGTILPAEKFYWRTEIQPVGEIISLNKWLRSFSAKRGIRLVDYYAAMATPEGAMRDGLSNDGVHPNLAGYRIMRELAEPVLIAAISKPRCARELAGKINF